MVEVDNVLVATEIWRTVNSSIGSVLRGLKPAGSHSRIQLVSQLQKLSQSRISRFLGVKKGSSGDVAGLTGVTKTP